MRKMMMRWLFTLFYLLVVTFGRRDVWFTYADGDELATYILGPLWVNHDIPGIYGGVMIGSYERTLFTPFNTI